MTATDMAALVGQVVTVRFESLHVDCTIRDTKAVYGAVRLLIEPVRGSGQQWIDIGRLVEPIATSTGASPC